MIPKISHQTWHSPSYTRNDGTPASWKALNPGWEYRLWLDDALEAFVAQSYPEFIALYRGYPLAVQRADLGRYLLLHHFGGFYADMDTDCLAPLDPIAQEARIVLCDEPRAQWGPARDFGLDRLLFNGTMASPAGHPFWLHLARLAERCKSAAAKNVLISTGPVLLTAAVQSWPQKGDFSLNSCHLFAPQESGGAPAADPVEGDYAALRLSRHNWSGSWYRDIGDSPARRIKGRLRQLKARLKRPAKPMDETDLAALDPALLHAKPAPFDPKNLPQVALFVPVKDGAAFLDRHMALIKALDWPKSRLRLVYCEGDSADDSRAKLEALKQIEGPQFAGFEILSHRSGLVLDRAKRWEPRMQFKRRCALARARNWMIKQGLKDQDEWVLWLDVDVCDFPTNILKTLLAAKEKIVTPDCVLSPGGPSFDLNAYLEIGHARRSEFYKYVKAGLFQPPAGYWRRMHMHDLRFLEKTPLNAVGGTMLLVHGSVHRAGLIFPERPYRHLIETEAFGRMAYDAGLIPIGLPNVEIRHVKS
ncbi:MAG: glycosyltransferase [Paracoccaceae bacterium]